jgi:DNA-binding response OmpR family regulator
VKTILLIENDPAILRLEQQVLRDAGYAGDPAGDGQQARTKAKDTPYHGIVLDLTVAGSEGYSLATQIGGLDANRHTPLIILGSDEPDGRRRAFDAGAMAFLPKPFTAEAFRAVIHSVISPAGPHAPTGPSVAIGRTSRPIASAPVAVSPAEAEVGAEPVEGSIPVSFQGGPVYWCPPNDAGTWRCGRCELGVIGAAEVGSSCGICQAAVVALQGESRSGIGWLIVFIALGLLIGWAVLQWWS